MTERDDEFYDWLLSHADSPEADSVLRRIYSSSPAGDGREADEAFAEFSAKAGIKPRRFWAAVRHASLRVAAALALPIGILCAWAMNKAFAPEPEWTRVSTACSETRTLALPDGSKAILSPGSQLFYPSEFRGRTRKVILVGEAFLDVAKDRRSRFMVSTGEMDVIVHGTKFNVNSFPDNEEDEVALLEGSVELSFPGKEESVFLSPGELIKFDRGSGSITRRHFAANYFEDVVNMSGLQFRNAPLSDIAATLMRRFDANIIIRDPELASERYYASFINGEDLDAILEALNTGHHFNVSLRDGIYYITK